MDIGSAAHTEFDYDESVVEFLMEDDERDDWKHGLIHSHNTMGVFFSGEDNDELAINCKTHNYYLSVIVNNFMDVIARVVFTAYPNRFKCLDDEGKEYNLNLPQIKNQEPVMMIHECIIEKPQISVSNIAFEQRFEQIDTKCRNRYKAQQQLKPPVQSISSTKSLPPSNTTNKQQEIRKAWEDWNVENSTNKTNKPTVPYEDFICAVLRSGTALKNDTIEEAMEDLLNMQLPDAAYAHIVSYYDAIYKNFFQKHQEFGTNAHYYRVFEQVVKRLELEILDYPFVKSMVQSLIKQVNEVSAKV